MATVSATAVLVQVPSRSKFSIGFVDVHVAQQRTSKMCAVPFRKQVPMPLIVVPAVATKQTLVVTVAVVAIVVARLALHASSSAAVVRDKVMKSARVQLAFFDVRCLSTLRSFPWRLADGDIEANLQTLAED